MSYAGKPILGIVGGVGSGKSHVARVLESIGCLVIDSDQQSRDAFRHPAVMTALRSLFGNDAVRTDGTADRKLIAAKVFETPELRQRLESIIHPIVNAQRDLLMLRNANDASLKAFVWDSPLLMEAGLDSQCDAVIFVETPFETRLARVKESRGWEESELKRREAAQMPLEEKQKKSSHTVRGDLDGEALRVELQRMLHDISDAVARSSRP